MKVYFLDWRLNRAVKLSLSFDNIDLWNKQMYYFLYIFKCYKYHITLSGKENFKIVN